MESISEDLSLHVEICATVLTEKPPKLPLREEYPSLGFEVIYNGEGLGERTCRYESKRAVEHYRREEISKDLKKRRFFPKSSRIKEQLAERKRVELELRMPHAFSYKSFEQQLYEDVDTTSTSGASSSQESLGVGSEKQPRQKIKKKRFAWNFFKRSRSSDSGKRPSTLRRAQTILDVLDDAGFSDLLDPEAKPLKDFGLQSEKETVASTEITATSGFLSGHSDKRDGIRNMEIQFVTSAALEKFLPGLNTVAESDSSSDEPGGLLDENVRNAFAKVEAEKIIVEVSRTKEEDQMLLFSKNLFADDESPVQPSGIQPDVTHAFQDVSTDIYGPVSNETPLVAGMSLPSISVSGMIISDSSSPSESIGLLDMGKSIGSVSTLFEALASKHTPAKEIENVLNLSPGLVQVKHFGDGRLPLHTLCDRGLPDRSNLHVSHLTEFLVHDIIAYRDLIGLIFKSYPEAACCFDKAGDLPVHLLARTLMEWEAVWYEGVYDEASKEKPPEGKISKAITSLYQTMSQSIEVVIEPVSHDSSLCLSGGSSGRLLPVHIACIFTSKVKTLRQILLAYPEGAKFKCDLGLLQSFVPDDSTPLELHEGLSTDFPKWEIERHHDRYPDITWSQLPDDRGDSEDHVRRSDLLLAFNPHIEPFRFENNRIRRVEDRIRAEARGVVIGDTSRLTETAKRLWIWLCSFQEDKHMRPTYIKSVQRIVDGLPQRALRYLASVSVGGRQVMDIANAQCAKLIRERIGGENPFGDVVILAGNSQSSALKLWNEAHLSRLTMHSRKQLAMLARFIFNVKEELFPTSFIILPYKLTKGAEGKLAMPSPTTAPQASKFAECLLQLTDPRAVLYFLDMKSVKHYGQSIYEAADDESARNLAYTKIIGYEAMLLGLYGSDEAYLYLLDEATGIPLISKSDKLYPITLREPVTMVRKLMPLMLVGMVLMRGERSLSVLVNILLDGSLTVVPRHWIEAADALHVYLTENGSEVLDSSSDVRRLQADLAHFRRGAKSKKRLTEKPKNCSTEWNVELSILKMLLDMSDPRRSYCGLIASRQAGRGVAWHIESAAAAEDEAYRTLTLHDTLREEGDSDVHTPGRISKFLKRIARVEEVRKKWDPIAKAEIAPEQLPDIEELSRKHDELSRQLGDIHSENGYNSQASPLGFPQPYNDSSDDDYHYRRRLASTFTTSDGSMCSDEMLLRQQKAFSESDEEPLNLMTMLSSATKRILLSKRHAPFFDELEFHGGIALDFASRLDYSTSRVVGRESSRIWIELTNQLDNSGMYLDNSNVLRTKVQLANEAKRLCSIHKRIDALKQEKLSIVARENDMARIALAQPQNSDFPGVDGQLLKARQLLMRLCNLEDKLLFSEIGIQHLNMEAFAIDKRIEELEEKKTTPEGSESPPAFKAAEQRGFDHDDLPASYDSDRSREVGWVKYHASTGRIEF